MVDGGGSAGGGWHDVPGAVESVTINRIGLRASDALHGDPCSVWWCAVRVVFAVQPLAEGDLGDRQPGIEIAADGLSIRGMCTGTECER